MFTNIAQAGTKIRLQSDTTAENYCSTPHSFFATTAAAQPVRGCIREPVSHKRTEPGNDIISELVLVEDGNRTGRRRRGPGRDGALRRP
jgi:hypothetical protein